MADEGLHVVVTIASNGVVHAWGEGPVVVENPDGLVKIKPFATRRRARAVASQFKREEKRRDTGDAVTVQVKVCKLLGIEPVEIKTTT